MAVRREKPADDLVFRSDRGIQYAFQAYRQALERFFNMIMRLFSISSAASCVN